MNIRRAVQSALTESEADHDSLLNKHGFEFDGYDEDEDESNGEWSAYRGVHPGSGKEHTVWVWPDHKEGYKWIHREGTNDEEYEHHVGSVLHQGGMIAGDKVPPAPTHQPEEHTGIGFKSLKQHIQKHFPIQ